MRSTLFKSCNYFFDNILNITKLSQKFGAIDVIISQSDAKQQNSRIMFSSKIRKAVIPSSAEHNELRFKLTNWSTILGFVLSNTAPGVHYQLSDCKCTILNLITIMELKVWSTSETRMSKRHGSE